MSARAIHDLRRWPTAHDDPPITSAAMAAVAVALRVMPFTGHKLPESVRSFAVQR